MAITSPSIPVISVIEVMRRLPSCRRLACTMTFTALAIWLRMALIGISIPAIATMFSSRLTPSRALLAWIVVIDPSWPVFMACSMSITSSPRVSPTMMRSGRIRRALRRQSRWVTAPRPSTLAGRLSMRPTCSCCSCNSAVSSMVRMRSELSMNEDSAFSVVVFPEPVPPDTMIFSRVATAACK